ncbi:DNA photolyase, FAD-binding/Cryptochrome [Blakeslea trispora]|nr:DNA photolyase, FAD-binding/Cryptochrome [Blakeslea trispora]
MSLHAILKTNSQLLPVVCIDPRMIDISRINKKINQNFEPPKTWYFKFDRVANFRTRFLYECIKSLKKELKNRDTDLLILYGKPEEMLPKLKKYLADNNLKVEKIHTHKEYAFEELRNEKDLSKAMDDDVVYHHDTMLVNPDDLDFVGERTYKVYTHFRKRIEAMENPVRDPLEIPEKLPPFPEIAWKFEHASQGEELLQELYENVPVKKDERTAFPWEGGEHSALERLNNYCFKSDGVANYKHTRNGLVGTEYSTKFSAFLANGCLSPRTIWHEMDLFEQQEGKKRKRSVKPHSDDDGVYWVKFELLWRDFFRLLTIGYGKRIFMLHGFRNLEKPEIAKEDRKKKVDKPPHPKNNYQNKVWRSDDDQFNKWADGETGIPFIDASMREMKYTGFLNNRGRQNVASFFAKDLEIDWRLGAEYFEYMLRDHDVYSNYGNWQYVAGVGCDPREGFRHFNILKQGFDYDPDAEYIKLWCPELKDLPTHYAHCPWLMSEEEQKEYKCEIGTDYPKPMAIFENWKRYYPAEAKKGSLHKFMKGGKDKSKKTKTN